MSKRMIGLALILLGSIGIGLLAAEKFFVLFDKVMPAGSMTELVRAGTHTAYLGSGVVFGVVIFGWTAAAVWLAKFFKTHAGAGTTVTGPPSK